jgi:hypothetical protein
LASLIGNVMGGTYRMRRDVAVGVYRDSGFVPHVERHVCAAAVQLRWRLAAARAYLREHVLESAGLLPLLEKTPLNPMVSGEIKHEGLMKLEERSRAAAG